jgi:hypothetical protein
MDAGCTLPSWAARPGRQDNGKLVMASAIDAAWLPWQSLEMAPHGYRSIAGDGYVGEKTLTGH